VAALNFVHLHVHSNYSLLEGAIPLARLADLAKADKQAALALTDTDNMFGTLEFSEKMASAGIQPIVGCALAIDFADTDHGARNANAPTPRERIVLLAARDAGYRSLMRLNSRAFLETPPNEPPRLKLEWLEGETDGIIALTGGPGGPLELRHLRRAEPPFQAQDLLAFGRHRRDAKCQGRTLPATLHMQERGRPPPARRSPAGLRLPPGPWGPRPRCCRRSRSWRRSSTRSARRSPSRSSTRASFAARSPS